MELLSIQSFLSEISRGRTKDKERARKELNELKRNVSSENLKEIVKNLEFAIFGPSEFDDDNDGEWDNFQESVAERVKKRRQDKISEEELKKHATGYRHLDNTTRDALGKRYNPKPGQEMVFDGFNNIIDDYQSGILSFYDVNAMFKNLNKSVELNNKYYDVLVCNGINQVLSLIYDGSIKYNEKAIINSIKNTNKELFNKKYYTTDSKGKIILSDYNAILNKLVSGFNNDPSSININKIHNMLNKLSNTMDNFDFKNLKNDREAFERTKKLYYGLIKIKNLAKKDEQNIAATQGKGLKILTPKQMLSRLPILLAQVHAGNNSQKLNNEI